MWLPLHRMTSFPTRTKGWITTWSITRQLSPTWNPGQVEARGLTWVISSYPMAFACS